MSKYIFYVFVITSIDWMCYCWCQRIKNWWAQKNNLYYYLKYSFCCPLHSAARRYRYTRPHEVRHCDRISSLGFGAFPDSPAPKITSLNRGEVYVASVTSFSVRSSPNCLVNFCRNSTRPCRQMTHSDESRTRQAGTAVLEISGVTTVHKFRASARCNIPNKEGVHS